MRRLALSLLALLAASACNPPWTPVTIIDELRVMGVRATSPEVKPGQPTGLQALLEDPSRPGQPTTTIWLGCEPDPFDMGRSACSDSALLADPSTLFANGALPAGVKVVGVNERAAYASSPTLFDVLPADDARRTAGVVGLVLAISVGEQVPLDASPQVLADVFARVQAKTVSSLITLFRLRVSESDTPNHNPAFDWFGVDGQAHPIGGTVVVQPAQKVTLLLGASPESFEHYQQALPTGVVEEKTEGVTVAWFSTSGRFSQERISMETQVPEVFTAPGADENDPVPAAKVGTLWAVGRDTRGGTTWDSFPFFVCDPSLATPAISRITAPATAADPVVVEGEHLESLLDLVVGGFALQDGAFSPTRGSWQGFVPAQLGSGTWPVTFSARSCAKADTGLMVTVP